MSNSQNENLEDVSKGNSESVNGEMDSSSNKKTRFTKSKSISEVFKELESEENDIQRMESEETTLSNMEIEEEIIESSDSSLDALDSSMETDSPIDESVVYLEEDEMDEIIPIHNEYEDLDESEAFNSESIDEEELSDSSELDSYVESIVNESDDLGSQELADSKENLDAVGGDIEDESIDSEDISQSYEEDLLEDEDGLLEEGMKVIKVNPDSSSDVLSKKEKGSLSSIKSIEMDSSFIITVLTFIVGLGILIMGIFYLGSSSDRVVDNVLSGETAGLAVFLIIIGLLIVGFSILRFLSSTKADQSSSMLDMLKSIRDIDYDDVKEDNISRDDFDSAFSSVFGKEEHSNFSNDDGDTSSVDNASDLFDEDDKISDEDIEALYSDSNLNTKTTSSTIQDSTDAQDIDSIGSKDNSTIDESLDGDSLIDKSPDEDSILNGSLDEEMTDSNDFDNAAEEEDSVSDLKDKYSKYNFDDDDAESKPQFKKSVDISKFDKDELSKEELEAEKRRKQEELEEKKRRIIQGTNFDNSLRK